MTAYQVYEQSIKPLSPEEKLAIARLIMDEVIPEAQLPSNPEPLTKVRQPREFGCARHLLSGAGIDVDALMATPIDDMFADYMQDSN
jgi:hypothetical protein